MKSHTTAEREAAEKNLPKPIHGFLGSKALSAIYEGISKKLRLNLREMLIVTEITSDTLLGLEPESEIETNLHQFLPELSNEKTRELVGDINDRIFKEARRRLEANILEPETPPIERLPTDAEFEQIAEKEKREGIVPEFEKQRQEEDARQAALLEEEKKRASAQSGIQSIEPSAPPVSDTLALKESALLPGTPSVPPAVEPTPPTAPISEQKLKAPTTAAASETAVQALPEEKPPIQRIAVPPPPPRTPSAADPYREPLD